MMKMLRKKRKGGFTLIELIVVIAILGILAAIAVPRFAGTLTSSKVKADQATLSTVISAVALAQAEGTITTATANRPTPAELVTAGYLQKAPVSQQNNTAFTISYSADWTVSDIKAGSITVTP